MLKARSALSGCFVLALLGAGWCAAIYAGKPAPPPPPPPPGKIVFASQGFWQMNGDGSGKTAVPFTSPSDASAAVPSLGSYAGHRWWLCIRELAPNQTDLYATKDGSDWIQLTASSITPNGDGTETHVRFFADPCWSNDGDDTFCSVKATYYIYNPATATGSNIHRIIYRVDISASDLEGMAPDDDDPLLSVGNPAVTPVISAAVPTGAGVEPLLDHHWSAESTDITFVRNNASPGAAMDLYFANVSHGPVDAADASLIYHNPSSFDVARPRWTPAGNTLGHEYIVFDCGNSIYTVSPDGSQLAPLTTGWGAFWSPDGQYLAYRVPVYLKGRTRLYDIARFPLLGGSVVTLISDSSDKVVKGWCE